jgi:Bacterial dnaA protein helix-turn-helix
MSFYTDDCRTGAEALARAKAVRQYFASLRGPVPPPVVAVSLPPPPPPPPVPEPPAAKPPPGKRALAKPSRIYTGPVSEIVDITAEYFNLSREDILGDRRTKQFVLARSVAMHVASVARKRSLPEIGRVMRKDHTTVLHDNRRIKIALANGNLEIAGAVKEITEELERRAALRPPAVKVSAKVRSAAWNRPPYTDEETEYLRKAFYDGEKIAHVAKKLGRNLSGLWRKLKKMGLSRKAQKAAIEST